jgi:hypothetical protein
MVTVEIHEAIGVAEDMLNTLRAVAQQYGARRYMLTEGPFPASTPKERRKLKQVKEAEAEVRQQIDAITVLVQSASETLVANNQMAVSDQGR